MTFDFKQFGEPGTATELKPSGGFNFESFGQQTDPASIPQDKGFIQELAQGIARPFLRSGLTAFRAGQGLTGIATKDIELLRRGGSTAPQKFGYFGEVSPITTAKEAIGAGAEIGSTLAAPATTIPKRFLGKIGVSAALGGLYGGGQSAELGGDTGEITKQTAIGAGTAAATTAAMLGLSSVVKKFTEKGFQTIIKPSKVDIEDGFKIENIQKYKLGGPLHKMQEKVESRIRELATQLHDKIGDAGEKIDLQDIFAKTSTDVGANKGKLLHFGTNTRINSALTQLQAEIQALDDPLLSVSDAQVVKQAAGSLGSWQFGKVDPDAIASEKIYNAFYRNLKTAIEKLSPDGVKAINKQLSELIPIQNAIIRRIPVADRNALLGLTDFIGLTASAFEPRAMGITLLNLLSKSGGALNVISKLEQPLQRLAAPTGAGISAVQSRFNTPNR